MKKLIILFILTTNVVFAGNEGPGGGEPYTQEFIDLGYQLSLYFQQNTKTLELPFSAREFYEKIKTIDDSIKDERATDKLEFTTEKLFDRDKVEKPAVFDISNNSIRVKRSAWKSYNYSEKLIQITMEVGGLLRVAVRYERASLWISGKAETIKRLLPKDAINLFQQTVEPYTFLGNKKIKRQASRPTCSENLSDYTSYNTINEKQKFIGYDNGRRVGGTYTMDGSIHVGGGKIVYSPQYKTEFELSHHSRSTEDAKSVLCAHLEKTCYRSLRRDLNSKSEEWEKLANLAQQHACDFEISKEFALEPELGEEALYPSQIFAVVAPVKYGSRLVYRPGEIVSFTDQTYLPLFNLTQGKLTSLESPIAEKGGQHKIFHLEDFRPIDFVKLNKNYGLESGQTLPKDLKGKILSYYLESGLFEVEFENSQTAFVPSMLLDVYLAKK